MTDREYRETRRLLLRSASDADARLSEYDAEFREGDMVKRSDVLYLFLQVNRGGVPQSDEHIARVRRLYEEAVAQESAAKEPS